MGARQVRVADGVLVHEEDGDAFLLHTATGRYFGLNRAGLVVWRALAAGEDPLDVLEQRWPDVPPEVLRRDAESLLGRLREAGLIVELGG